MKFPSNTFSFLAKLWPKRHKRRPLEFINYMPKRIRIIVATLIMTMIMAISTFFTFTESWYIFVIILLLASYTLTYIAVYEGIDGVEWYTLFIMPMLLTVSLYLFYSLLPVRWLTRLPFLVLFAFVYYAMLLSSNIFNVGVEKSIQLYRAAFSINYLAQSFIVFLLMTVVLSFRFNAVVNGLVIFIITLILSLQLFWSVKLEQHLQKKIIRYSFGAAFILLEISVLASFVPFRSNMFALVLTASYYSISGIIYNYLAERLFKNVIREYTFVLVFVVFIALLTIQW